jgi:hypothetical protein
VISSAKWGLRAHRTVSRLRLVRDATVVPHDPAPMTATLVATRSTLLTTTRGQNGGARV